MPPHARHFVGPDESMKALSERASEIIVAFGGGKDSLVTLDLAKRYIPTVHVVSMYMFPDLVFDREYENMIAERYGVTVVRVPNPIVVDMIRQGAYGSNPKTVESIPKRWQPHNNWKRRADDFRSILGKPPTTWVATGLKRVDSLGVAINLNRIGYELDFDNHNAYPLATVTNTGVWNYIKRDKLPPHPWYQTGAKHSFDTVYGVTLEAIKTHWPEDFERIKAVFPLIDAVLYRKEVNVKPERKRRKRKDATLHNRAHSPLGNRQSAV